MSSKSSSSSRTGSPRAMPVETIITRFKSAQQRKLREMDRSMQKITELLKTPKRKRRTTKIQQIKKETPECPKTEKDVHQQGTVETEEEYYPAKLKRRVVLNKVQLKPKELTVIATTNKRKRTIPQKDLSSAIDPEASHSEGSVPKRLKTLTKDVSLTDMNEMIRLIEANGGVDDEGLVEILTCPSPVWWEDPPDGYHEEAVFTRPRSSMEMYPSVRSQIEDSLERKRPHTPNVLSRTEKKKCAEENEHEQENEQKADSDSANIDVSLSLNNCDEKFIAKRSKLETVLGCLKNKASKNDSRESNKVSVIKNVSSDRDDLSDDEQIAVVYEIIETDSEATDDDRLTDVSFHDDDHLNILENINIPIQDSVSTRTSKCTNNECEDEDLLDCKIERSDNNEIGNVCRDLLGAKNAEISAGNEQSQISDFLDRTKNRDFLEHNKTDELAVDNSEGVLKNELNTETSNNNKQHSSHISELKSSEAVGDEIQTPSVFLERARSTFLDDREVLGHENEISSNFLDYADEISLSKDVRQQIRSSPIYKANEKENSNIFLDDARNFKFVNCEQQSNENEQISREDFQTSRNIAATRDNNDVPVDVETKSTNFLEEDNVASFSEGKMADEELQTVYVYEEFEDAEEPQVEPSGDFLDEDRRFEENRGHNFEQEPIQYETRSDANYERSKTVENHHEVESDTYQEVFEKYLTNKSKRFKKTANNYKNENVDHFIEIKAASCPKENHRDNSFQQSQNINNFDKQGLRNVQNDEVITIRNNNNFEEAEAATNYLIKESTNSHEYNHFREIRTPGKSNLVNEYDESIVKNYEDLENSGILKNNQISVFEKASSILRNVLSAESVEKCEPNCTLDEYISGYKKGRACYKSAGNILELACARAFSKETETKEQKLNANKEAVPIAKEDNFRYADVQKSCGKDQTKYEQTHLNAVNNLEKEKEVFAGSLTVNDHPKENSRGETQNGDNCEDNLFLKDTPSNNNYEVPAYEESVPYEEQSTFQEAQSVNNNDQQDIFDANNYEQQNTFEESLRVENYDTKRTIYEEPTTFQEPILHSYERSAVNNYEKQKSFKEASAVCNYETDGNIDKQSSSYVEPHIPTNFGQLLVSRPSRASVYNQRKKDSRSKTGNEIYFKYAERPVSNSEEVESIRDLKKIQSYNDLVGQQPLCHFNAQTNETFEIKSLNDIKNCETDRKISESRDHVKEVSCNGGFQEIQNVNDPDKKQSTNHTDLGTIGNVYIAPFNNANYDFNVNYADRQSSCNLEQLKSNINLQKVQSNNNIEEPLSCGVQKEENFAISQAFNTYKDVVDVDKFVNEQRASNANGQSDLNSKATPANVFLETESLSDSEDNDALVIVETPYDTNPFKKIDFENLSSEKFLETQSSNDLGRTQGFNNFEPENIATNIIETINRFNDTKSVTKINVDEPNNGEKVIKTPSFSCADDFEEYVANIIKKIQSAEKNTDSSGVNDTKNKEDLEKSHTSLLEQYLTVDMHEQEPVKHCNTRNGLKKPESTSNVLKFRNPDESSINILKIESVVPRNMPPLKRCGSRRCNEGCLPTSSPPPLKRYPSVIQTNFATEPKTIVFDTIDTVTNLLQDKLDSMSDSNMCILNEDGDDCVETTEYNNGVRITSINMSNNKDTKTIKLCSNRSISSSSAKHKNDDDNNVNCTNTNSFPVNLSQNLCLYGSEFEFAHNNGASDFEVQSLTITKLNNVNQHQPPYESEKKHSFKLSNSKNRSRSKSKNSENVKSKNNNVVKHDSNAVLSTKTSTIEKEQPIYSDKAAKNKEKIEYYYKQCKNFYEKQKFLAGKIDVTNRNIILDKSLVTKKHCGYTNNQSETNIQLNCVKNTPNKKIEITNDVIINKITNGNNQITINKVQFDNQILTSDNKINSTSKVVSDSKQKSLNDLGSNLLPNKGLTVNKILVTTKEIESIMKNSAINLVTYPKQDATNDLNTTEPQTPYNDIAFNRVQFANSNKNESIGITPHDPIFEVTVSKVPLVQHEYGYSAKDDVSNNSGIIEITKIPVANHYSVTPETNNDVDSFSNTETENKLTITNGKKAEKEVKKTPLNKNECKGSIESNGCYQGSDCDEKDCDNEIDSFMIENKLPNEFLNVKNDDILKSVESTQDKISLNKSNYYEFHVPETPKTSTSDSEKDSKNKPSLTMQKEFINELVIAEDVNLYKKHETHHYDDATNIMQKDYEFQDPELSDIYCSNAEKNSHYEFNNHTIQNEINNESQNVKNNDLKKVETDFLFPECPEPSTNLFEDSRKHSKNELNLNIQNKVSNEVKDAHTINVFKEDEANNNGVPTKTNIKENNKDLVTKTPKPSSSNCKTDSNAKKSNTLNELINESQNTKTDYVVNEKDAVSTSKVKKDGEFRVPDPPKPRVKKSKVNKVKVRNERRLIIKSKSKHVKFCMQCSSVYDTKLCNYCFRRSRSPNVNKVNQCNKHYIFKLDHVFTCDFCKYKASSKANLQQHMLSKRCGSSKR